MPFFCRSSSHSSYSSIFLAQNLQFHYSFSAGKGVVVERAYCGTFVTSLEMAGVSITVLHLNDTFKRCLGKLL